MKGFIHIFPNILTATYVLACFIQHSVVLYGKESEKLGSYLDRDFFGLQTRAFFNKKTKLSNSDVSVLSAVLSSTSSTAGSDALLFLTNLAKNQPNALASFFSICTALTTLDPSNADVTPISVATPEVKLALSKGIIPLLTNDYNYTLLHFATLFSAIGDAISSTTDIKKSAATIIRAILSNLTQKQIFKAITVQDMWGNTPLHYAAIVPSAGQEEITRALLSPLTNNSDVANAITVRDIWGYVPHQILSL
jgi:hypothetical protein